MWRTITYVLCACLLLGQGAFAQQRPAAPPPEPPAAAKAGAPDDLHSYVLGADDTISIWALECDEISGKNFTVDKSGSLSLPLVGRMHVAGLTVEQFETELKNQLRRFLYKPEVAVSVTDFKSQPVSLVGAVARPGVYQLRGGRRLMDLLTEAGGLRADAGTFGRLSRQAEWGAIPLPRAVADPVSKGSVAEINLRTLQSAEDSSANVLLKPNDVLSVPVGDLIYVIGEVGKPGSLPATDHGSMSVLQAISMAGGLTKGAAPKDAKILRVSDNHSERSQIPVDVKSLLAGKSKDIGLEPNDILLVPDSTGKKVRERAVDTAISLGSSLLTLGLIYR